MNSKFTHISVIYDTGNHFKEYPGLELPAPDKLRTFEFTMADKRWLYLDPYGHDVLPRKIQKRLFGRDKGFSIAVCLDDGELATASKVKEDGNLALYVESFESWSSMFGKPYNYRVPKDFVFLIDTLRSAKRPFYLTISEYGMFQFIEREIGYVELAGFVVVSLDFGNRGYLKILNDSYWWQTECKQSK